MQTNDPETSHHVFFNDVQTPKNTRVDLATVVACGETTRVSWEDGGGFDKQDFFFDVVGKCGYKNKSNPRLVK